MNSLICDIIQNNIDWQEILTEKQIRIGYKDAFAIFNYGICADFSDAVVQEARGIIIDINTCSVVCYPFRKFGNYHESYADTIDWTTARVQEKIDGSIIKMWYNPYSNKWQISSNSCIDANDAVMPSGVSIAKIVMSTNEYKEIVSKNILDKNFTYIFELVSPYNQVVIRYPKSKLYYIGVRNNLTGIEYNTKDTLTSVSIDRPKEYPLHSLDDCISAVKSLNKQSYPDNEGFVVVDANYHRIKVKSPEYLIYHHLVNNGCLNKEKAWELIHTDDFKLEDFVEVATDANVKAIRYYIYAFDEAKESILRLMYDVQECVSRGMTRKEIALKISKNKYAYFGFKAIDISETPKDFLDHIDAKTFLRYIDEFDYNSVI